ncbi:MAG: hypothetical protein ACRDY0_09975 [Acidimicrobiales bacterium]
MSPTTRPIKATADTKKGDTKKRAGQPAGAPRSPRAAPPARARKARKPSRLARALGRIPAARRWQIRRLLRFIDKYKEQGKRLPPEIYEMERFLAQNKVPKAKRASVLEDAMAAQEDGSIAFGRDYKRAAAAQQRRSGKGAGKRPGLPPGTLSQARRKSP